VAEERRIRTPFAQQWRRIRYQLFPVLAFGASVVLTVWLWGHQVGLPNTVGEVNLIQVQATSSVDGVLAALPGRTFEVFDTVKSGEVVARLDSQQILAAVDTFKKDLARIRGDLAAAEAQALRDQALHEQGAKAEAERLAVGVERIRLEILAHKADLEADRAELKGLTERYQAVKDLYDHGIESRLVLVEAASARDVVQERIAGYERAIREAEAQRKAAEERLKTLGPVQSPNLEAILAPFRAAITTQEALIRETETQLAATDVRSPVDGMVSAIYYHPGQAVKAGEWIMTISANQNQYVVCYLRQEQRIQPKVGMPVEVHVRSIPVNVIPARVDRVGGQVEAVPPHQLRDPKTVEWGLPVRIVLPTGAILRPGELVDVTFKTAAVGGAG